MDVSIIIISYNTRDLTVACLRSVYEQTADIEYEVIVLDNNSQDGSVEAIADEFPQVQLIKSKQNMGFAMGNNIAAQNAQGKYLLLLNPDTVILEGAIQHAIMFAEEHTEFSIVGGRTYFDDMSLNYSSCHGFPTLWSLTCLGLGFASAFRRSSFLNPEGYGCWLRDSVRQVDAVTGCFMLMKRELWNQLDGFDTDFFMYGEETDLCWRAAKLGNKSVITPDANLIHYGGASEKVRSDKMIRLFQAKARLFKKHWPPMQARYGMAMLKCWALSRMIVLFFLNSIQPKHIDLYLAWREIWHRRDEYAQDSSHQQ